MNKLFPILFGVAIGSAATYFAMDARQSTTAQAPAEKIAAPKSASKFASKSTGPNADAPAVEAPRQPGNTKFGGKGGFLPEEIEGVTPEQLNQCRVALFKTFQDEGVKAVRAKQAELRKEAEYASDDEKKNLRTQFEDTAAELRTATKTAMMAADADITNDVADKVLDAIEERMKQRAQQFKK